MKLPIRIVYLMRLVKQQTLNTSDIPTYERFNKQEIVRLQVTLSMHVQEGEKVRGRQYSHLSLFSVNIGSRRLLYRVRHKLETVKSLCVPPSFISALLEIVDNIECTLGSHQCLMVMSCHTNHDYLCSCVVSLYHIG